MGPIAIVSPRPGTLTEIRIGCLLPAMAASDRDNYELLADAIEARLDAALRIDDGDSYGANVEFDALQGGTTFLVASTHVGPETLAHALAALRGNWQRWSREGFDTSELNVARWRYAGGLALRHGSGTPSRSSSRARGCASRRCRRRDDTRRGGAGRRPVNELFATCRANAVLGLTGNEALIRRALAEAWPGLAAKR